MHILTKQLQKKIEQYKKLDPGDKRFFLVEEGNKLANRAGNVASMDASEELQQELLDIKAHWENLVN